MGEGRIAVEVAEIDGFFTDGGVYGQFFEIADGCVVFSPLAVTLACIFDFGIFALDECRDVGQGGGGVDGDVVDYAVCVAVAAGVGGR